ncbi:hypothetical protein O3S80_21450 [Streptomyces sp. Lzd4kr]|nr:hypothetical protein [Streptomyces sp. Lzd4kr]
MTTTRSTTAAQKCPHCGRVMGEQSCREVKLGFYCLMRGLLLDDSKLIYPSRDQIGKHEQAAIDEYGPQVEQAEALTDAAIEALSAAQRTHIDALFECHRLGVIAPGMPSLVAADGRGFGVAVDYGRRGTMTGRSRRKLIDAEESARAEVEACEDRLTRERRNLSRLERKYENAQRVARSQDREAS